MSARHSALSVMDMPARKAKKGVAVKPEMSDGEWKGPKLHIEPGITHSLWIDTTPDTNYPYLEGDDSVDIAIIGGGIVGITSAYLLKMAGKKVAVLEMDRIAKRTTGNTTAKVTALHGYLYTYLVAHHPLESARAYAIANEEAIGQIREVIKNNKIDCDFIPASAYTYSASKKEVKYVKEELDASKKVGLDTYYVEESDLPFDIVGAVRLDNQAHFHPRKYLLPLAAKIPGEGSAIYENTTVHGVNDRDNVVIKARSKGEFHTITAKKAIFASQLPFYDKGKFFMRTTPLFSYAVGARLGGKLPQGMYYTDDEEHHSMRTQPVGKTDVQIFGGGEHKSGHGGNTFLHYDDVAFFADRYFDVKEFVYYWSTMDYTTEDGLPFVGYSPGSSKVMLAFGFGGWGMTNSMVASRLLTDMITGKNNELEKIFDPSRRTTENERFGKRVEASVRSVVLHEKPKKQRMITSVSELHKGEGALVPVGERKYAVYNDEKGIIHAFDPHCTHRGCVVNWNPAERTWDCPCHGSRFYTNGEVRHDPAFLPLMKVGISKLEKQAKKK